MGYRAPESDAAVGVFRGEPDQKAVRRRGRKQGLADGRALQQAPGLGGVAAEKHFAELVEKASRWNVPQLSGDRRRMFGNGWVYVKAELGLEAQGAKQPNRVFRQTLSGFPDEPQTPLLDVLDAAHIVQNLLFVRIVVEGVYGEVPAEGVLIQGAIDVVPPDGAVAVGFLVFVRRLAEGGDLDDVAPVAHMGDLEAAAHHARASKQSAHLLRRGAGGHIKVLGLGAKQQVADAAADQQRLKAGALQLGDDVKGVGINLFPGDLEWP